MNDCLARVTLYYTSLFANITALPLTRRMLPIEFGKQTPALGPLESWAGAVARLAGG